MDHTQWLLNNLIVVAIQLIALTFYTLGSRKFYIEQPKFLRWIGLGIATDVLVAFIASLGWVPIVESGHIPPTGSILFWTHVICACVGMFGFIGMFIYLVIRGTQHIHRLRCLRFFQYKVLLRVWYFGVGIAIIDFMVKALFGVRMYDYI